MYLIFRSLGSCPLLLRFRCSDGKPENPMDRRNIIYRVPDYIFRYTFWFSSILFRRAPDLSGLLLGLHRLMPSGAKPSGGYREVCVKSYIVAIYLRLNAREKPSCLGRPQPGSLAPGFNLQIKSTVNFSFGSDARETAPSLRGLRASRGEASGPPANAET